MSPTTSPPSSPNVKLPGSSAAPLLPPLHHLGSWAFVSNIARISSINFQFIRFIYLLIFAIAPRLPLTAPPPLPPSIPQPATMLHFTSQFPLHWLLFFALFLCALRLLFSVCPLFPCPLPPLSTCSSSLSS